MDTEARRIRARFAAALTLLGFSLITTGHAWANEGRGRRVGEGALRITEARGDLELGQLSIRGESFGHRRRDRLLVTLSGQLLSITSQTDVEIVAQLPAGIEPGTYRLVVERFGGSHASDTLD